MGASRTLPTIKYTSMPTPCLWYASDAQTAFALYVEALPGAELTMDNGFMCELGFGQGDESADDAPGGSRIAGMNGGPAYRPNQSLSIYAELSSAAEVEHAFAKLTSSLKATVLMPLDAYFWSDRYAWVADAWGVHWQLSYVPGAAPTLSPALLFAGKAYGRASEAVTLYGSLFRDSETLAVAHYPDGPDAGKVMHAQQRLGDGKLILLDSSAAAREADFTEGGSLMLFCDTQAEIDHYWNGLTAGGGSAGRCGWCKDRFGVSWQIVPRGLGGWLSNPATARKTGEALQAMSKLVIAELEPKGGGDVWAALRGS